MENSLGLTEHHKYQILELLRYSRNKRKEKVIGIELAFQDFVDTRVMDEDTFTQDEVGSFRLFSGQPFACIMTNMLFIYFIILMNFASPSVLLH